MRLTMLKAGALAVMGLALVNPSVLAGNNAPKPSSKKNSTTASSALASLHQAKTLLETAIHDYDGHRGKALEEVHHAIKELTPHVQGKGAKVNAENKALKAAANGGKQGTTPGETQEQSDKQLKQALEILSTLHGQIPSTHPKAGTHVGNAVGELNTALKIK